MLFDFSLPWRGYWTSESLCLTMSAMQCCQQLRRRKVLVHNQRQSLRRSIPQPTRRAGTAQTQRRWVQQVERLRKRRRDMWRSQRGR